MLQLPYGAVSILGLIFLKDRIEINAIWERDLDLLEELEEKEKEIEIRLDWVDFLQLSSMGNGFEVPLGYHESFFPRGCNLLPEIPPEV